MRAAAVDVVGSTVFPRLASARESLCVHDGLRLDTPDALVCYMLPDAPVHDPRHFEALLGVSK